MKLASLALLFALAGCSSSDPQPAAADDAGTADASATDASDAMAKDSEAPSTSDAGADTGSKDGGKDAAAMSADCKTYCDCFEANCASIQKIPNGMSCGDFCATFTKDQWTCRNAHCQLVVPENNPYHCQHAVGIDQCM